MVTSLVIVLVLLIFLDTVLFITVVGTCVKRDITSKSTSSSSRSMVFLLRLYISCVWGSFFCVLLRFGWISPGWCTGNTMELTIGLRALRLYEFWVERILWFTQFKKEVIKVSMTSFLNWVVIMLPDLFVFFSLKFW